MSRCEVCDTPEGECTCFCKCGLHPLDCVCRWTEEDFKNKND